MGTGIADDEWAVGQDLISRLLERKPTRRLGMLNGRAADIKRHKWFEGLDWEALEARKMEPPRRPKDDSAKRLRELTVRSLAHSPP
jgi:cGMP-dependent protein kinase 2